MWGCWVMGKERFSELRRSIEGISQRMLTLTLKELQRDGLIARTAYPAIPPRVQYELTKRGHSLLKPITELGDWARQNRSYSPCFAKIKLRVVQFRGFSKMTLSSLQAQAPRVILSGFSASNCTEKTKRKPVCQTCQLRAP
jgi:DNA-binding HxlR family transcriptional regulator